LNQSQITYLTFGIVLVLAVIFDLGLLSKKGTVFTIKKAFYQTLFWVLLALAFFGFLWYENGHKTALEYLSAYLMEWSLSIDNIFVFILIFTCDQEPWHFTLV
jgi:tellurite resistance protein TerC